MADPVLDAHPCPHCGAQLSAQAKFCGSCGAPTTVPCVPASAGSTTARQAPNLFAGGKWRRIAAGTAVLCIALLAGAAILLFSDRGKPGQQAAEVSAGPTPSDAAAEPGIPVREQAPAVLYANALGTTIPLEPGGSVFVPEGALSAGAQISAELTRSPLLPEGVEAAGNAYLVQASAEPLQPVILRLPVPQGADSPEELVIVRAGADGSITLLQTWVDGLDLVAATPGFSTFVAGRLAEPGHVLALDGKGWLAPGEKTAYFADWDRRRSVSEARWWAYGPVTITWQDRYNAILQAGERLATAYLYYECIDLDGGFGWFGSAQVVVRSADSVAAYVGVAPWPPTTYSEEGTVTITACVYGRFETPTTWTWIISDGAEGGPVTIDSACIQLPDLTVTGESGTYMVRVFATDKVGRKAFGYGFYEVLVRPYRVRVEGPRALVWSDPAAYGAYTAGGEGGAPPYDYAFLQLPGDKPRVDSGDTNTATFAFDQPGGHYLKLLGMDGRGTMAAATLPVHVVGGERLSARIIGLPATSRPGQVEAAVEVRGGVLVGAGKKTGYLVTIDWGDGQAADGQVAGAEVTPYEGAVVEAAHEYTAPGKYTVRVDAWDATGMHDRSLQEIAITEEVEEPEAAASPASTAPESPTAEPTAGLLVWVRQERAVVNANDEPLEFRAPEPRFAGTFSRMTPGETSFTTEERYVEHEVEWYNVSVTCSFDTPPLVLNPGLRYQVKATCSHGGSAAQGAEGLGERFWYSAETGRGVVVEPPETLTYYPWASDSGRTASKEWMVEAPVVGRPGDTFQLYAGLWNRPACNVTWTYRAEYH